VTDGHRDSAARSALTRISVFCRTLAAAGLALMTALVIGQVVGRNLFDLGLPWADELARFCGVSLVFLCVPLLALHGQHVCVDLIPQALPNRLRRIVLIVGELAVLVFCALTLAGFHAFLTRAWKFSTPALGLPNWLFYAPALAGFLLLLLISGLRCAELCRAPHRETRPTS
jgi:TRAP-type C4-dicarboxylate transport system permease small subunit